MNKIRPYRQIIECLRGAGLRPTRQRMALAKMLFEGEGRHVTAEVLHNESISNGVSVSLATVYNTLNQFTAAGLLREIVVDGERSYFDTTTTDHHHFFHTNTGKLEDIMADDVIMQNLPVPPMGTKITSVNVIVRVSPA